MTSFNGDIQQIILLLEMDIQRREQDLIVIKEHLASLKNKYDQRIQQINDDSNGTRPENWNK